MLILVFGCVKIVDFGLLPMDMVLYDYGCNVAAFF